MEMSIIQSRCNSFFENNDFEDLCEIMYQATNQNLFSSPSLGMIKKGTATSEALPTCPALMSSISFDNGAELSEDFFSKIFNRSIHKWEPGELDAYQPLAVSKINEIAKKLGYEGVLSIDPKNEENCAEFGEMLLVNANPDTARITACKPFYRDLIGLNGLDLQQEAEGIAAHEIGHIAFQNYPLFKKLDEIRADFFTLRNGHTARGLLNSLKRTQKLFPLEHEIRLRGLNPSHPYFFERIQYLTEGLCGIYPEQNPDIC